MYICLECQNLFHEPKSYVETHGLDTPPYEKWNGCPNCSGHYVIARECNCCNHYIVGDYIKLSNGERICENCYETMEAGDEDY